MGGNGCRASLMCSVFAKTPTGIYPGVSGGGWEEGGAEEGG